MARKTRNTRTVTPAPAPVAATPAPAPAAPAPRPVLSAGARWRDRFGAAVDAAPTAEAPAILGMDPDRGLVNPCRAAGLMRAFVGDVVDVGAVRADGIDYVALVVDCGGVVATLRTSDRSIGCNARVYFRGTPVGALADGRVSISGPRSLRLVRAGDPGPGVHTY